MACAGPATSPASSPLPQTSRSPPIRWSEPLSLVSNKEVLDLFKYKDCHAEITDKVAYEWVKNMYGDNWPETPPTVASLKQSVVRLRCKLSKIKKQKYSEKRDTEIESFLQRDYELPSMALHKGTVVRFSPVKDCRSRTCHQKSNDAHPINAQQKSGKPAAMMYPPSGTAVSHLKNQNLKKRLLETPINV